MTLYMYIMYYNWTCISYKTANLYTFCLLDGKRFDYDCDLHAQSLFKERFKCSPAQDAISRHQEDLNAPLRAKRKLDMDADPQSISLKRTKSGDYEVCSYFAKCLR